MKIAEPGLTQNEDGRKHHEAVRPVSLGGRLSFEQLVIKLADSIVPVLVFTEFRLSDASERLLFQNIQLLIKKHYQFAADMLRIMGWHVRPLLEASVTKRTLVSIHLMP